MSRILVSVKNQELQVISYNCGIVSGTQEFVQFHFEMDHGWDGLMVFAQFGQDGHTYNSYLDENNNVYLPTEIQAGKCTLMLYGTGGDVIGTTNYLTLKIDKDIMVSDASSTQITESLYQQLVDLVRTVGSPTDEQVNAAVAPILEDYVEEGRLGPLVIGDGTLPRSKVDSSFEATLDLADSAVQPNDLDDVIEYRENYIYTTEFRTGNGVTVTFSGDNTVVATLYAGTEKSAYCEIDTRSISNLVVSFDNESLDDNIKWGSLSRPGASAVIMRGSINSSPTVLDVSDYGAVRIILYVSSGSSQAGDSITFQKLQVENGITQTAFHMQNTTRTAIDLVSRDGIGTLNAALDEVIIVDDEEPSAEHNELWIDPTGYTGVSIATTPELEYVESGLYSYTQKSPHTISSNYRLEYTGYTSSNSDYVLKKYAVTVGASYKVVSDDKFQFQTSAETTSSGTNYRVGETYGSGIFMVEAPATATTLIVSTLKTGSTADVKLVDHSYINDLKTDLNRTEVLCDTIDVYVPFHAKSGDSVMVRTKDDTTFTVTSLRFYDENKTLTDYMNLSSTKKARAYTYSQNSECSFVMIHGGTVQDIEVLNLSEFVADAIYGDIAKVYTAMDSKFVSENRIKVTGNALDTYYNFYAETGDSITITAQSGANFTVGQIRFYNIEKKELDYYNLKAANIKTKTITLANESSLALSDCAYIKFTNQTAEAVDVVNNTKTKDYLILATSETAQQNTVTIEKNARIMAKCDTLGEYIGFYANVGDSITVRTVSGSIFTPSRIVFCNAKKQEIAYANLSASNKAERTFTLTNDTSVSDGVCHFAYLYGGTAQDIEVINNSENLHDAVSVLVGKGPSAAMKLLGKTLWTIWDSLGENGWQSDFVDLTGCDFYPSLNVSAVNPISKGGTTSLPYVDDGTQKRAMNLVARKNSYPIDVVIIENINDKSLLSNTGLITDQPFMRSQRININTGATSYENAVAYANANLSTILGNVASADRKKGTVLAFNYTSGSTICGSKITFTGTPSVEGDMFVWWGSSKKSIHVTTGMSIYDLASAVEAYSWGSGVTDTNNGDGSVTITYYTATENRITFDANGTGVTATVTDSAAQGTYPMYYYGYNSTDWTDTTKWSATITLYSVYKGLLEYLISELPEAEIYWSMPWNANVDFSQSTYKNPDGTWSQDKFMLQENNQQTMALYAVQKAVSEHYSVPVLDLYTKGGMSICNVETYFYTNNPHPKADGYKRWAEVMAAMVY